MSRKNQVLIIAEAGVNHNGSLSRALELVDVAAECGADVVKFQTFRSEKVVSQRAKKAEYQLAATGSDESQLEMIKKLELKAEDHFKLLDRCKEKDIEFMSTPFDLDSLSLLVHDLKIGRIKAPSGELTNPVLLLAIARSQLPIILSSGMSTLGELEQALGIIAFGLINKSGIPKKASEITRAFSSGEGQDFLRKRVTILHCTTEYPAPFDEVNLNAIRTISRAFHLPVGYSDHTLGIHISLAAVALGATVIEKHFTLDKNLPGPDHKASLEPSELKSMVRQIRDISVAMGDGRKIPTLSEISNIEIARRSLVAGTAIELGDVFTEENVDLKRPGNGMSPLLYWNLLGKKASRRYEADELLEE